MRVPYGMSVHGNDEIEAVVEVLKTSTQMGKNVREFEEKISLLFDKRFGLMLNSGSSALYLGVEVMNIPKGSEVITPVLTFSTTVASLVKNNLVPSFIDVEPDTFLIDIDKIEEMITNKTKAIVIPNLLGNIPDWDEIALIAKKYDLKILEDSADTLGGTLKGKSTGYFSDISITSFYGSHIINCAGNGGMLCLNDEQMYHKAKLLRSWGRTSSIFIDSEKIENRFNVELDNIKYDSKFVFEELGYNLEPSELGAAFGLVQLKNLQKNIENRIENFNKHYNFFKQYEEYLILPKQTKHTRTGWLAFPLIVKQIAPFTRTELQIALEKRDIQTRVIFTGNILRQPGFKNIISKKNRSGYPNADNVMRGGILIACHHGLTNKMIDHIHNSFIEFIKNY